LLLFSCSASRRADDCVSTCCIPCGRGSALDAADPRLVDAQPSAPALALDWLMHLVLCCCCCFSSASSWRSSSSSESSLWFLASSDSLMACRLSHLFCSISVLSVSFSQPFGKEHVSRKENWSVDIAKVDEKIA